MFIYQRYIIKNVLTSFLGVLFTITSLVWLSQIIKLVFLIDRGAGFLGFLYLSLLILPSLLFAILPFATILATVLTYNRLSYERELIVLSNSGLNNWSVIKPGATLAVIITIFTYIISFYLLPTSTRLLKSGLKHFRSHYVVSLVQENTFTNISKNVVLYVDSKEPGNILKGLIIFDEKDPNRKAVIFARYGNLNSSANTNPSLNLKNGMRQETDLDGKLTKMYYDTLSISLSNQSDCDENEIHGKCNQIINPLSRDLNELYINELFLLKPETQDKKFKMLAEGHQRIIWPLYNIALTVLSLSIFMSKPYSRRGNSGIIYQVALVVAAFIAMHFICYNAASKNVVLNILSYMNLGLCFILSYYLLNHSTKTKREK